MTNRIASFSLRRLPGRQRHLAIAAANSRSANYKLAAAEADLTVSPAPALTYATSAVTMRYASDFLHFLAPHLLNHSNASVRQKRANEQSTCRQITSRLGTNAIDEGVVLFFMELALLFGFDKPSLMAQDNRCVPFYFNIDRDIPGRGMGAASI